MLLVDHPIDASDHVFIEPESGSVENFHRPKANLRSDANDADVVIGRSDGAGDMGAVSVVISRVVRLRKGVVSTGVVCGQIGMQSVDAGIENRHVYRPGAFRQRPQLGGAHHRYSERHHLCCRVDAAVRRSSQRSVDRGVPLNNWRDESDLTRSPEVSDLCRRQICRKCVDRFKGTNFL